MPRQRLHREKKNRGGEGIVGETGEASGRTGKRKAERVPELKASSKIIKEEARVFVFCHTSLYTCMCAGVCGGVHGYVYTCVKILCMCVSIYM